MANCQISLNAAAFEVLILLPGSATFIILLIHVIVTLVRLGRPGDSGSWLPNPRWSAINCLSSIAAGISGICSGTAYTFRMYHYRYTVRLSLGRMKLGQSIYHSLALQPPQQ